VDDGDVKGGGGGCRYSRRQEVRRGCTRRSPSENSAVSPDRRGLLMMNHYWYETQFDHGEMICSPILLAVRPDLVQSAGCTRQLPLPPAGLSLTKERQKKGRKGKYSPLTMLPAHPPVPDPASSLLPIPGSSCFRPPGAKVEATGCSVSWRVRKCDVLRGDFLLLSGCDCRRKEGCTKRRGCYMSTIYQYSWECRVRFAPPSPEKYRKLRDVIIDVTGKCEVPGLTQLTDIARLYVSIFL
jgi:hypothetical protein